jgi:hypothetical protein
MAVDVSQVDPILAKLNELYSGTTLHREKLDAWTLLRDIADAFAAGDISESELKGYVSEIAQTVCAQIASQGKSYSPEKLADELFQLAKQRAVTTSGARYMAMVERLRSARERARERRERLSVL